MLDSQIINPVLIADKDSLGTWRNAISSSKMIADWGLRQAPDSWVDKRFPSAANSIYADVSLVWDRLILDSNEISPTGGRPKRIQEEILNRKENKL